MDVLAPSQIAKIVMDGGRLGMPDLQQLPGGRGGLSGLEGYVALIQRCWAQSPEDRPSFGEIIAELR
jgi:hypothetical protein